MRSGGSVGSGRGEIIFQELYDHRTDPEEQKQPGRIEPRNRGTPFKTAGKPSRSKQLANHQDNKKAVK